MEVNSVLLIWFELLNKVGDFFLYLTDPFCHEIVSIFIYERWSSNFSRVVLQE